MRFAVEKEVFSRLENVCFGIVVARGIDNRNSRSEISALLDSSIGSIRERLQDINLKEYPAINLYREAFVKLDFNPNKFMCSIEALVKRIMKGGEFPRINNIVDLGNAISLKYILPLGAHDLNKAEGDIEVRFSRPEDVFVPFGAVEAEKPELGELVYASGSKVKTRRWIWRQSDEGKITEDSSNVFFPIDGFADTNLEAVMASRDELAQALKAIFNCEVKVGLVDKDNPYMEL